MSCGVILAFLEKEWDLAMLWLMVTYVVTFLSLNEGMHAGLSKYVPVNLKDIEAAGFEEGEEVSLESLKEIGLINPSGRERRLPLKV